LALVPVVGDVRREVRVLAVRAPRDTVLVVAQVARLDPQRALGLVQPPERAQHLERLLDLRRRALVQRRLVEPRVEPDAEALERRLHPADQLLDALLAELLPGGIVRAGDRPGELDDVLALVAALRDFFAARAGADRHAELRDL